MNKKLSVGFISLGCDKNRVDTEKALAILSKEYLISNEPEESDVIVINTCAFLESSRKEAIEEILWACALKNIKPNLKIIVTGCFPQRFIDEIYPELTEVDAFLGISDYNLLPSVIKKVMQGERVNAVGKPSGEPCKERVLTTRTHAYLKISDGCSNHCTYCLIPSIRGAYRSVPLLDLIEEAKMLGDVNELILVAQDTTKYGIDLPEKPTLSLLVDKLSKLSNVKSIRILYCYPEGITDELIQTIKTNQKVIKYIDVPMQHASDKTLKLMNRKGSKAEYLQLVERLKKEIPDIAIRSTFITGFPGETEQAFDDLVDFIQKAKLFNAGFFAYSREEGTPAYKLPNQIDKRTKTQRLKKLYSLQKQVVKQNLATFKGKTLKVVCEGFDQNYFTYYGRAYFNAPDIDGKVYFFSADEVEVGKTYDVKIIKAQGYDLFGDRI